MSGTIWERFEHDPRRPEHAALRASDRDRDLVHEVLGSSFAEGRLTRDELEERSDHVTSAKTLGQLPAVVSDLVSLSNVPAPRPAADLRTEAERRYRDQLRGALLTFLVPTLICWAIWLGQGHDGFPWPVWVMFSGMPLLRLLTSHHDTVTSIHQRLEHRERRLMQRYARHERKHLGHGSRPPTPW